MMAAKDAAPAMDAVLDEDHPLPPEAKVGLLPQEPWPDLDAFGRADMPPFPVEALPGWMRDFVEAEAEFTQTPVDLAALLALAAAALCASRGVDVEVVPGWTEPTNLWVVVGLPPGERKSPVFESVTRPITAYLRLVGEQLEKQIGDYNSDVDILKGKIAAAQAAAVKSKLFEGEDARRAASRLRSELADLAPVTAPNLLADDITPEAVAKMLSENGERMGLFSEEGGPLEAMAGRYTETPNLDIWLKGHHGGAFSVARIKREPLHLRRPLITIAVTTQPSVIAGMGADKLKRAKGLLARFMFVLPRSRVGERKTDNVEPVPDPVARAYLHSLSAILCHAPEHPRVLRMSAGANEARADFARALEPRLGPDGDLHGIADWANKLTGLVARLAGVLHASDHADRLHLAPSGEDAIAKATWLRAESIGLYALAHASNAFSVMGADDLTSTAIRMLDWTRRRQVTRCSAKELRDAVRVRAEDGDPAIRDLVARGYLRVAQAAPVRQTAGRPASTLYDVRPHD